MRRRSRTCPASGRIRRRSSGRRRSGRGGTCGSLVRQAVENRCEVTMADRKIEPYRLSAPWQPKAKALHGFRGDIAFLPTLRTGGPPVVRGLNLADASCDHVRIPRLTECEPVFWLVATRRNGVRAVLWSSALRA